MNFLELESVSKSYDGTRAVHNLDLAVPQGSIYGIIGPNGAGKSTTIRMIMNIIAPDSGSIRANGRAIDESFKDIVGYLPEERGLYKKMKIREVITYLARLKGYRGAGDTTEIDRWLTKMGLEEYRERKVEELSKGMQQKLQFITTVFHHPQLIVLDELFSGLDPLNIELVKNALFDLRDDGATILFSTHVMEQAEKMVDSVAMFCKGEKILDGRLSDVKGQFGKNTAHIVLDRNDASLVRQHAAVESVLEFPNYLEAALKPGADHMTLLRDLCAVARVSRFELVSPSLYNIFIAAAKIDPNSPEASPGATVQTGESHV